MNPVPKSVEWIGGPEGHLRLLDQTRLPGEVVFRDHYGNLVTNVPASGLVGMGLPRRQGDQPPAADDLVARHLGLDQMFVDRRKGASSRHTGHPTRTPKSALGTRCQRGASRFATF